MNIETNSIQTKEELIKLIYLLSKESVMKSNSWRNNDLSSYLEAIASWIEDMDGFYENMGKSLPEKINWSVFADILMAARIYE